jgi:hydrogenase nickel incorporation protein HypA/HybF
VHELSLSRGIVDIAERHASGRPVLAVRVRAGQLRQVVPESLAFCFEIASRGTACEGARLEIEVVPARASCGRCGWHGELRPPLLTCVRCNDGALTVRSGEELEVESIEIDEEVAAACTARRSR